MNRTILLLCIFSLLLALGCSKKNTIEVVAPPEGEDCNLSRKVYQEDGEWKVAVIPGHSMITSYPKSQKCIEKEKEMERLYIEHLLKKE